jgi:hypothetical protein
MMGGLSILAVGLVIGVAIAWVLPGLPRVAARAAPRAEKPAGEPNPDAGPKNDQPSLVKLDADDTARVRDDGAGDDDPTRYGPALDRSQCDGRVSVVELRKNFGEPVEKNEVLAVLESRGPRILSGEDLL